MQLDDFKTHWDTYDRKLNKNWQLSLALLRQTRWQQTRSALQKLALGAWVELFLGLATAMVLGGFIAAHFTQWQFLLPAVALHVFTISQIVFNGYQVATLQEIKFDAPILLSQKRLANLRRWRIRATLGAFVIAPLLWVPLLIVSVKGLLGLNLYAVLSPAWLVVNVLFGAAVIPLTLWVARRYRARWQNSPRVQQFLDDVAGRSLKEANAFLQELSEFERETNTA